MIKVALTYIIKDDSQKEEFERSLKSFTPYFDKVYVAVTGPSGQHSEIHKLVKKYGGYSISTTPQTHPQIYHQWEEGKWEFARFHEARQVVWDMVPADKYDYISWADHDDLLIGGEEIQGLLKQAQEKDLDLIYATYWYSNIFDEQGNVKKTVIMHERERFIRPNVAKWKSHLHEVLIPTKANIKMTPYTRNPEEGRNLVWVHTAKLENSFASLKRNIKILELQAKEENYKDPRTLLYLGKTYYDMGPDYFETALRYFDMYIPMSGWDEEIGNAYEYKGMILSRFGKNKEAIESYKVSTVYFPSNHTTYLKLAEVLIIENNLPLAIHYIKVFETLGPVTSKATISSPLEVEMLYYSVKWQQAHKEGKLEECLEWAKKRHELVQDKLLEDTIYLKESEMLAQGFLNLATFYLKNKMYNEVKTLLDMTPKAFEGEEFTKRIVQQIPGEKHNDKSIAYFASFYGPHFEKWNGDNLKVGIGGSESAVIYLSEEWVKQGYDVTVYCDTDEDKVINGVNYKKYWKINFNDEFNIFISWRTPHFLDFNIKARNHFVDLHDIVNSSDWYESRCNKVDKVFFKSTWHSRQIPQLPKDKRVVISNGITL
jgi:tetratricopeptide (TPR) repeat protein